MSSYDDPASPGPFPPSRPAPPPVPGRTVVRTVVGFVLLVVVFLGAAAYTLHHQRAPVDPRPVAPRGDLAPAELSTIELFKRSSPSVVFITTVTRSRDPFDFQEAREGTGSGFIWDDQGHIVTNFHVIRGASGAEVTLADHSTFKATLVGTAPEFDLAVLKIRAPASSLPPVLVGTSHDLQVGQSVFAIGNPFGLDQTLTTGVISALGRRIASQSARPIEDAIQTNAAINPGNSGGPLLDSAGRLIGVNTAIVSPSGGSAGIGFAIPVDTVNRAVPDLIAHGKIVRPRMGVQLAGTEINRRLKVRGVLVLGLEPGSPAERAGIRGTKRDEEGRLVLGDVLTKVGGQPVGSADDIGEALEKHKVGDRVTVTVFRDGAETTIEVTLEAG